MDRPPETKTNMSGELIPSPAPASSLPGFSCRPRKPRSASAIFSRLSSTTTTRGRRISMRPAALQSGPRPTVFARARRGRALPHSRLHQGPAGQGAPGKTVVGPHGQATPGCAAHAFRLAVIGQVIEVNSAHAVRGPKHVSKKARPLFSQPRKPANCSTAFPLRRRSREHGRPG
jgi:hypothetical protein